MKKQKLSLIILIAFLLHGIFVYSQDNRRQDDPPQDDKSSTKYDFGTPDFNTWTEEKIRQWEDSVKNILYPPLEIRISNKTNDSKPLGNDGGSNYRAINNTHVPNSVVVDKTKAVGEIPVTSAVSPTGSIAFLQ